MNFTPTAEQQAILDAYATGGSLRIEAGAGTGKTSTLKLMANAQPGRRMLYLVYNAAAAKDARQSMPKNVDACTAHAFAMRSLRGSQNPQVTAVLSRLRAPRVPNSQIGEQLGVRRPLDLGPGMQALQPAGLVALARATLTAWCHSGDDEITEGHVPAILGASPDAQAAAGTEIAAMARKLWEDATSPTGQGRTDHDHYLKLYALSHPAWGDRYDVTATDESQDLNPVLVTMLGPQQAGSHQLVVVGDRAQTLYAWRGAVDAMDRFPADHVLQLTQSFRFGPVIAHEANKWLTAIDANLRLSGTPSARSRVTNLDHADAVLCRTNATGMSHLIEGQRQGRTTALSGGGADIRRFAEAAEQLKTTGQTWLPELMAFKSWPAVQDFVAHDGGGDLASMVNLIDTYGERVVTAAVDACVDEADASLVVSTAHRAKGREWKTVKIADDFPTPIDGKDLSKSEGMLAYVAVTRARGQLDRGSLGWIDGYLADRRLAVDVSRSVGVNATPQPPLGQTQAGGAARPVGARTPAVGTRPPTSAPSVRRRHAQLPSDDPWAAPPLIEAPNTPHAITVDVQPEVWAMIEQWAKSSGTTPSKVVSDALTHLHGAAAAQKASAGRAFYEPAPRTDGARWAGAV